MGFLATLLLSIVFATLGVARPRLAVYLVLMLFVFFDEQGLGFTTYRGSFVFNAFFVGFYGLRLIEVLTVSAYIPMLFMVRDRQQASQPFHAERLISFLFFSWIAILLAVEFAISGKASHSDWRLIVTGAMQFHMLVLTFRDESAVERLVQFFLSLLALKAAYGLGMYAAGHGVLTPRGKLPFYWDSQQVQAFGLGVVILTGYLLNYASLSARHRIFPFALALLMWLLLVAAVGGSIRRTIWVMTFAGVLFMILLSKRSTFIHYFVILFASAVAIAGLLLAPGLDDFRTHMGKYVESMNVFDEQQFSGNVENSVHINNVESYLKMVTEKTDILALGLHGPSGAQQYQMLMDIYSEGGYKLGMAHNGILRSILFFGIFGAILYVAVYAISLSRTWQIYRHAPEDNVLKHVALACGAFLLLDFAPSLLFVPPFYTSSKGLFYAFFQIFIVGVVAWRLVPRAGRTTITVASPHATEAPRVFARQTVSKG